MTRKSGAWEDGFSLIELVVVIAIAGVIASVIGVFIAGPIQGFFDTARRAELVDAGQLALVRMGRDLRAALPNSVRVTGTSLELLQTIDGDRYRTEPGSGAVDADQLEFDREDDSFNTFRQLGAGQGTLPGGLRLAVYPLGDGTGSDPYVEGDRTMTPRTKTVDVLAGTSTIGGVTEYRVSITPGHRFPYASPRQRVFLVRGPVTYRCAANDLVRYDGYDVDATQPDPPSVGLGLTSTVVVDDLVQSCAFSYDPGTARRNAVVSLSLALADPDAPTEVIRLVRQVNLSNVP